jgi:hypothetical protein
MRSTDGQDKAHDDRGAPGETRVLRQQQINDRHR